ncbi:hypothetical protein CBL_10121 [Carabus blaptoides fortunei]
MIIDDSIPGPSPATEPSAVLNCSTTSRARQTSRFRVKNLTPKAKYLHESNRVLKRRFVSKCKAAKRLQDLFKLAVAKKQPGLLERGVGNLNSMTRNFFISNIRESGKKKQDRRFSLYEKIIAVSMWKSMRGSYRMLEKYFTVPSKTTLKRLLSRIPFHPGVNQLLHHHLTKIERYLNIGLPPVPVSPGLSRNGGSPSRSKENLTGTRDYPGIVYYKDRK